MCKHGKSICLFSLLALFSLHSLVGQQYFITAEELATLYSNLVKSNKANSQLIENLKKQELVLNQALEESASLKETIAKQEKQIVDLTIDLNNSNKSLAQAQSQIPILQTQIEAQKKYLIVLRNAELIKIIGAGVGGVSIGIIGTAIYFLIK